LIEWFAAFVPSRPTTISTYRRCHSSLLIDDIAHHQYYTHHNIKKMAIASNTNNCKPCCSKKGTCSKKFKKVVPYEEMERLMNVYGALKAVRNRSAKSSKNEDGKKEGEGKGCQVKRESIKRKFYRWFPDLEQRFFRTEEGQYQPIHGHEQEVSYRKQMREKSFESVAQKRARAN